MRKGVVGGWRGEGGLTEVGLCDAGPCGATAEQDGFLAVPEGQNTPRP